MGLHAVESDELEDQGQHAAAEAETNGLDCRKSNYKKGLGGSDIGVIILKSILNFSRTQPDACLACGPLSYWSFGLLLSLLSRARKLG